MPYLKSSRADRARALKLFYAVVDVMRQGGYRIVLTKIDENHRLVDRHRVRLGHIGFHDPKRRIVYLDYRYEFVVALVHEFLHAAFPEAAEEVVLEMHELLLHYLRPGEIFRLLDLAVPLCRQPFRRPRDC